MTTEKIPGVEARVGARWWANKIRDGFRPDNGADPDSVTKSPEALGLIAAVHAADIRDVTSEQVDIYEAALGRYIQAIIDEHGHATYFGAMELGCDYGPGPAHREALQEAGIKPGVTVLPWKTHMWVQPGRVAVSDGYGAAIVELPLEEPVR